jgi:hypothetical protein
MDAHAVLWLVLEIVGAVLTVLTLIDVFLTVLYARFGTSIFSNRVGRGTWRVFRFIAESFPGPRKTLLAFGGPAILVVNVLVWASALTLGNALVFYPKLGTSIQLPTGDTPTDFVSALYAAANSMSIVGSGNFSPQTAPFKLLYIFNSLVGVAMVSLVVTYFMQIYTALQRRNVATLRGQFATNCTGDAAELLAGICPDGDPSNAVSRIADLAAAMTDVKEAHHFYSMLIYFRFADPSYSPTRLALVSLDAVELLKTAMSDDRYAQLKESASTQALWHASHQFLTGMREALLGERSTSSYPPAKPQQREQWRRRYAAAVRRLRDAGIETIDDEEAGAEAYVELRQQWNGYVDAYSDFMKYDLSDIDTAGAHPEAADARRPFRSRLRSV